nr:methyl-accepting chemotaxis protein [Sphingomonas xinjiangensis]
MRIPTKLKLGFGIVILISLIVSTMVFLNARSIDDASFKNVRANRLNATGQKAMGDLATARAELATFVVNRDPGSRSRFETATSSFQAKMAEYEKTTSVEAQRERTKKLQTLGRDYTSRAEALFAIAANPARQSEAISTLKTANDTGDIESLGTELLQVAQERIDVRTGEQNAAYDWTVQLLIFGGIAGLISSMGMAWLMSNQIGAPVAGITAAMRRLAEGDNEVPVEGAARKDEIGAMASALLVFRDQAVAKVKAERLKADADAEQNRLVTSLSDGLDRLSKGDLTAQIEGNFSAGYDTVRANFNEALTSLRALIGAVSESAAAIRTGSGEIAQASEDLARRTEANAASLEETSAAITQMDGRLKATAQAANRTAVRADDAISTVRGGREIADEALQAMTRVNDSAKGIDSVIEGLDKIAFQTRVLAMNAAVEAGRAGEAGRGFAVVADLVSALAMRAEEEAGRARDQLTATQTDIVSAVEMVRKVDGALADITGGVGEVHSLVSQIATDNQSQSTAVSQISVAIGTMDQSTQQNAAMVEQTSAAARNLSSEVSALAEQAAKFDVGAQPARKPARSAPAKAASSYVSPVRSLPASISAHAGGDDWASF